MARTIATIQAALIADVIANFTTLANDPNTSPTDKILLLSFVANTSTVSYTHLRTNWK